LRRNASRRRPRSSHGSYSLASVARAFAPRPGGRGLVRRKARRYKPAMRRSTRLGLLALAVVLLVAAAPGVYTAFWFIAAARLQNGIGVGAKSLHAKKIEVSWGAVRVVGFPFSLRVEFTDASVLDRVPVSASTVRFPRLVADAVPWDFSVWRLSAPNGLRMTAGTGPTPVATLSVPSATGVVFVPDGGPDGGGVKLWFALDAPQADSGVPLAARRAYLWFTLPAHQPRTDSQPAAGFAVDAWDLTLPSVPAPFHNPLDEFSLAVTVRGPVPSTLPRQAAIAWRDAGGTADVDRFALHWGPLRLSGSGTFALASDLQPEGAFSCAVEGYKQLLTALVAAGHIRPASAGIAQLALGLLAKTGPDGRPEISTSFTIEDGQMFLGPVAIGPAPQIAW
jgi:hypothetical protein